MTKITTAIIVITIAIIFSSCSNPAMPAVQSSTALAAEEGILEEIPAAEETPTAASSPADPGVPFVEELPATDEQAGTEESPVTEEKPVTEENPVAETSPSDDFRGPEWAQGIGRLADVDWESFDWSEMTPEEILEYLGIRGNHNGWFK